jgi:hypothetical protein
MSSDVGQPLEWWWKRPHTCLARWNLHDPAPLGDGQISVGKLGEDRWYVDHGGFGCRSFPDRDAAWRAVRSLMRLHEGHWEQVSGDSERRSPLLFNGARVIYSDGGDDMHGHWGKLRKERLTRYLSAIHAAPRLRHSEEHPAMGGHVTLAEYRDPYDGSTRFVVDDQHEAVPHVVDYPYRKQADRVYVRSVWSRAGRRFPYVSTDVPNVPTSRHPSPLRRSEGDIILYDQVPEYEDLWR